MKVIYSPRNSGKTTELINRSHETGKYILVDSQKEARRVFDFALSLDKSIPYPVTVAEVQGQHHLGKSSLREGVLIDNLEFVLYALLGLEVDTLVVEEAERVEPKPKKYYLKHKFLGSSGYNFLIYFINGNEYIINDCCSGDSFKSEFTDKEIEEIEASGFDLRNFEKVEVEND